MVLWDGSMGVFTHSVSIRWRFYYFFDYLMEGFCKGNRYKDQESDFNLDVYRTFRFCIRRDCERVNINREKEGIEHLSLRKEE